MSNKIRPYEEPLDDAVEAEIESEFRFNPAQARKNVLPRGLRKVPVTLFLDEDVVAYFKQLAERAPTLSYQAHVNHVLREAIAATSESNLLITDELLNDPRFVQLLDERIKAFVSKTEKTPAPRKRRAA